MGPWGLLVETAVKIQCIRMHVYRLFFGMYVNGPLQMICISRIPCACTVDAPQVLETSSVLLYSKAILNALSETICLGQQMIPKLGTQNLQIPMSAQQLLTHMSSLPLQKLHACG